MARSATFTVTAASSHSSAHNSRSEMPKYLIGTQQNEENFYDLVYDDEQFIELAKMKYQAITKQKMQSKQINALIKETVFSLESHHTPDDVREVFRELNKKYGGHYITELSIHKDEGHFEDKNGITYYPTTDILKKGDDWYIIPLTQSVEMLPGYKPKAEEFSEKVDISDFKPIYNIHAHIKFSMFDLETGKTGRMKHNELNDRIKTAAKILKLSYDPEKKNAERKRIGQIKQQHKAVRNERVHQILNLGEVLEAKEQQIQELQNENTTNNYTLKEMQARIVGLENANTELRKELHALNRDINKTKDEVEKDRKIKELEAKIVALEDRIDPIMPTKMLELQKENTLLKLTNKALETEISELKSIDTIDDSISYKTELLHIIQNNEAYKINDNSPTKNEFETLQQEVKNINAYDVKSIKAASVKTGTFGRESFDPIKYDENIQKVLDEHKRLHEKSFSFIKSFYEAKDIIIEGAKDLIQRTEKTVKSILEKVIGNRNLELSNGKKDQYKGRGR